MKKASLSSAFVAVQGAGLFDDLVYARCLAGAGSLSFGL